MEVRSANAFESLQNMSPDVRSQLGIKDVTFADAPVEWVAGVCVCAGTRELLLS